MEAANWVVPDFFTLLRALILGPMPKVRSVNLRGCLKNGMPWWPRKNPARKAPLRIVFPENDPLAWSRGDRTSAAEGVSIDTHVSQEGFGETSGSPGKTGRSGQGGSWKVSVPPCQINTEGVTEVLSCSGFATKSKVSRKFLPGFESFGARRGRTPVNLPANAPGADSRPKSSRLLRFW